MLFKTQLRPVTESWHLTNDPSRTSGIIGISNDAIHEPIAGHQLNILWQNTFSDLYIFGVDAGVFHTVDDQR